jgi:ABC-type uncharacterized transport system permease subunit
MRESTTRFRLPTLVYLLFATAFLCSVLLMWFDTPAPCYSGVEGGACPFSSILTPPAAAFMILLGSVGLVSILIPRFGWPVACASLSLGLASGLAFVLVWPADDPVGTIAAPALVFVVSSVGSIGLAVWSWRAERRKSPPSREVGGSARTSAGEST